MKQLRLCSLIALAIFAVGAFSISPERANAQSLNWGGHSNSTKNVVAIPPDVYKVGYFKNANTTGAPDGTVELDNPGTTGGNVCAQIYVSDPDQEMTECCACLLTPGGLRTLSVNTDLTSNPLTGKLLTSGVVSIVSGYTTTNVCSPLNNIVYPALRAWGTHIQNGSFAITETEYLDATLSTGNDYQLRQCQAIYTDGSGQGICSCGTGD